jgi:hypothetical protein
VAGRLAGLCSLALPHPHRKDSPMPFPISPYPEPAKDRLLASSERPPRSHHFLSSRAKRGIRFYNSSLVTRHQPLAGPEPRRDTSSILHARPCTIPRPERAKGAFFCTTPKTNRRIFNTFQTLSAKHPGWHTLLGLRRKPTTPHPPLPIFHKNIIPKDLPGGGPRRISFQRS